MTRDTADDDFCARIWDMDAEQLRSLYKWVYLLMQYKYRHGDDAQQVRQLAERQQEA